MVRSLKFIVKNMCVYEGLQGCVRERKGINKNINNDTKIYPKIDDKSMHKLYS